MKKLHLIGFTPDHDGLILSPRKGAKSGGFVVSLDDDLVSSIEQARRRRDGEEQEGTAGGAGSDADARALRLRPRSSLSPRDIQARLRAGGTISEVASQAGVDDEWVVRFAAPILAEQAQVVQGAQRLTFVKSRRGPSIEPLAPSVQWNLSDRGVQFSDDVFADSWTAYNLHGARWAVRFAYTSRKRRQVAEWEVDLRERSLVARNRLATDLGHVEAGRRRPSVEPADPGALETGPPNSPGREAATKRTVPRSAASRSAATKAPVAKRASPKAAATKAATKAAVTKTAKAAGATKAAGTRAATNTAGKAAGTRAATKAAGTRAATKAAGTKAGAAKAAGRGRRGGSSRAAAAGAPSRGPGGKGSAASRAAVGGRGAATAGLAKWGAGGRETPASEIAGKRAGRESSPRKARPAKKPAPDTPGGSSARTGRSAAPAVEAYADRASHLARPPSPMKMANRATSYPGQRLTATYAREAPPPRVGRASGSPPASGPPSNPANPRFEPSPAPGREPGAQRAAKSEAGETRPPAAPGTATGPRAPAAPGTATGSGGTSAPGAGGEAAPGARIAPGGTSPPGAAAPAPPVAKPPVAPPIGRRPLATRPGGGIVEDRPAVVILSTPASGDLPGPRPDDSEGQARLAAASRLRAALAVAPERATGPRPAPRGAAAPVPRSRREPGHSAGR